MRVIVLFEFSGRVREAFRARGHDAVSCDLLPSELPGPHLQCDVRAVPNLDSYDLAICHPPCTDLAVSGALLFKAKGAERIASALRCVEWCMRLPIKRIAIEQPVSIAATRIDWSGWKKQYVQPWMFGHGETKKTAFFRKNLPMLRATLIVSGRVARVHRESPGPDRWKNRSRTYPGIAAAMAEQWGNV